MIWSNLNPWVLIAMATCQLLRLLFVTAMLGAVLAPEARAQAPKSGESLTLQDVVKLSKAGISEDVIITKIRKNGKAFDLSPDEIVELKKTGIGNSVINYLLDPSQPYAPAPVLPAPSPSRADGPAAAPSPPSPPAKHYPADAYASRVPSEPGLYRFPGEAPVKVDIKILLGTKEGAGLGAVLMKKGKMIAYLVGPAAKTRITEPAPVFYMRLPEGKAIEEIVLLAFDCKSGRREIEMGPKQELKAEAMRQFDSLEVGQGLFKVTAAKLAKGEYLFFQLGSAEPPKGSYGKGFDFGIDAPHK
jgi:hypothetical protein